MPTSKITINLGSLDPCGHLSWLVESLSRDSVLGRNWTILMPAHKILKNCPPFFIFKNSERVLRIDIGRWKFQKFIITYLSLPRKNLKTQLQLLLPLNFAYAKKLLVKRAIFVLLFEGTNFIQKLIFISKNWPRLMKISEIHKDISELVWKKFGWWHLIPSWPEFCVLLFFTLVFGCFVTLDLGLYKNSTGVENGKFNARLIIVLSTSSSDRISPSVTLYQHSQFVKKLEINITFRSVTKISK